MKAIGVIVACIAVSLVAYFVLAPRLEGHPENREPHDAVPAVEETTGSTPSQEQEVAVPAAPSPSGQSAQSPTSPASAPSQSTPVPASTPTPAPTPAPNPTPTPTPTDTAPAASAYPIHRNITATVFWVGEPQGGGSSEDNALSAWDDEWQKSFGGFDDPQNRSGYYPKGFTPKENPFYLDVPYNDFTDSGKRKANASQVVPWANEKTWGPRESMMKNRWVKLTRNGVTCYGQIQDAGPYEYDDHAYVFGDGTVKPKTKLANNAGLDVSPALRDCLKFNGWNNADNKVDWQFVDAADVPAGPWKEIVTTSQINW